MAKRNGGIIGPSNVPSPFIAKGVWKLSDAFNYQKAGLWPTVLGYQIPNSCRFNSGSTDNLQRTFSSGNRRTYTLSFWVKKTAINETNFIFQSLQDGNNYGQIYFSGDTFGYESYIGANQFQLITSQVFRDVSAWYHIIVSVDTTQATSSNRGKIYVNGSLVSLGTSIYPSQNYDTFFNQNRTHTIGANTFSGFGNLLNGYLSEFYWIDGQALTPSSFGETDSTTGIWIPKAYTGTYGTNGFYLKFANSAALGTDSSGNGNTFTANNLTSIDQSYDSPTNNFATFNPLMYSTANNATLTDGNLTVLSVTGTFSVTPATLAVGSGKWYYEVKCISGTLGDRTAKVGWGNPDKGASMETEGSILYRNNTGNKFIDNTGSSYGATWTDGDIIGVALDISGGTVTFYKNGTTQGNITISGGLDDGTFYIPLVDVGNTDKLSVNFGNPPYAANSYTDANGFGNFSYAVPSGYYSLCSKNLAVYG